MKIKMTTFAITNKNEMFENRRTLTVGKDISKELAEDFLKANFAFIVEEDAKEEIKTLEEVIVEDKTEEEVIEEKPTKKKRGK